MKAGEKLAAVMAALLLLSGCAEREAQQETPTAAPTPTPAETVKAAETTTGAGPAEEKDESGELEGFRVYDVANLPLTAEEALPDGVEVQRSIELTLAMEQDEELGSFAPAPESVLRDTYRFKNAGQQDAELTLYVPWAGNLYFTPKVRAEGLEPEKIHMGAPLSGYDWSGFWGFPALGSFEELKQALGPGEYLSSALHWDDRGLSQVEAKVYDIGKVHGAEGFAHIKGVVDVAVEFTCSEAEAQILAYGLGKFSPRMEPGRENRLTCEFNWDSSMPRRLIVLGGELSDFRFSGYEALNGDARADIEGVWAEVESSDMKLGSDVLPGALTPFLEAQSNDFEPMMTAENLYRAYAEALVNMGAGGVLARELGLAEETVPPGRRGGFTLHALEGLVQASERIFYSEYRMTVPAGGEAELVLHRTVEYSQDVEGSYGWTLGVDFAAALGSPLDFGETAFTLEVPEGYELGGQNMGLVLTGTRAETALPPGREHSYFELRRSGAE